LFKSLFIFDNYYLIVIYLIQIISITLKKKVSEKKIEKKLFLQNNINNHKT